MAIDTTATRAMSGLLDTLLQMSSMASERQFRADEAELSREFAREQNELNAAAENFQYLRGRKPALEDEMRGYTLPYQTKVGGEMISGTLQSYQTGSQTEMTKIGQLTQSLGLIADAKDFAKGQADEHGAIIKAGKDEAWRDYMLEGGLEMGEEGLVGTGEMVPWLEKQSPGTIEKLKDANYRRSMMTSLRTIEEAKNLQAIDLQLQQANATIEATELAISKNEFEYSVAQLNESDKQIFDIYKNTALSTKSNFRYTSDGIAYSITDLFSVAASDIDDFIDIKEGFLSDPANYAIAHEAESFISGIQQAASVGMDDSEYVVRFQKGAYDNYVQLQTLTATLMEDASRENKTLQQYLAVLPANDNTKATFKRLNDKHTGYKRLGLFKVGYEMLDRGAQVVNMHNAVQSLRLSLDASTAEKIAEEGLGLKELEDYSPAGDLTPKMQQDLEVSLATLAAMTPYPGGQNIAPINKETTSSELTDQLNLLYKSGFQGTDIYSNISDSLTALNRDILYEQEYKDYVAKMQRKIEQGQVSDEEILELSTLMGISVEDLRSSLEQRRTKRAEGRQPTPSAAYERGLQK